MKRILNYTIGWDTKAKKGYLKAIDEEKVSHVFGGLSLEEFKVLQDLLKEEKVFIDKDKWIIGGWDENKDNYEVSR